MDKIVTIVDGMVSEVGSYEELISSQGSFAKFLDTYSKNNNESDVDTDSDGKIDICKYEILYFPLKNTL